MGKKSSNYRPVQTCQNCEFSSNLSYGLQCTRIPRSDVPITIEEMANRLRHSFVISKCDSREKLKALLKSFGACNLHQLDFTKYEEFWDRVNAIIPLDLVTLVSPMSICDLFEDKRA